jgi:hypothetical protein
VRKHPPEATYEYSEGRKAFREGRAPDDNPYPRLPDGWSDRRACWFRGFYDARSREFLRQVSFRSWEYWAEVAERRIQAQQAAERRRTKESSGKPS